MGRFRSYALLILVLLVAAAGSYMTLRHHVQQVSPPRNYGATPATQPTPAADPLLPDEQLDSGMYSQSSKLSLTGKVVRGLLTEIPAIEGSEVDITFSGHIVGAGDTLSEIAASNDSSVAAIQELNGLIDPHNLLVGQELIVSKGYSGPGVLAKSIEQGEFVREVLGKSALGYPIESFRAGSGRFHAVVVGAIHGGYEWNTALLAYRLITYFSVYPDRIPADVTLHIIPVANPDGLAAITGQPGPFLAADISGDTTLGRLNGNGVDLNRNWGCEWSAQGKWQQASVSGGTRPMSEPETRALRHFFARTGPAVVIWLHSAASLLAPGNCNDIDHQASERAAILYGLHSAYLVGEFNAYRVTGDAADWLAQHKIASFTVELSNHRDLEFDRNLAGLLSLLKGIDTLSQE